MPADDCGSLLLILSVAEREDDLFSVVHRKAEPDAGRMAIRGCAVACSARAEADDANSTTSHRRQRIVDVVITGARSARKRDRREGFVVIVSCLYNR